MSINLYETEMMLEGGIRGGEEEEEEEIVNLYSLVLCGY
jgi:hypothetical protein